MVTESPCRTVPLNSKKEQEYIPCLSDTARTAEDSKNRTTKKRSKKAVSYSDNFESFWKLYPARNGRKTGKALAAIEFEKIDPKRYRDLRLAINNLSASDQLPKDAHRFLRADRKTNVAPWEEWVDSAGEGSQYSSPRIPGIPSAEETRRQSAKIHGRQ